MAHLVRPHLIRFYLTRHVDKDGNPVAKGTPGAKKVRSRVPRGTPGAERVRERSRKWYAAGVPGQPKGKRIPLASDRTAAQQMLADLVRRAELGAAGLAGPAVEHAQRPLAEHLKDFEEVLRGRGVTSKQLSLKVGRIRRALAECGFEYMADLSASKLESFLAGLRQESAPPALDPDRQEFTRDELAAALGVEPETVNALVRRNRLGASGAGKARRYPRATAEALCRNRGRGHGVQTANYYLREAKSFCRWLVDDRRMPANPLAHLKGGNAKLDRRHDRRTLTAEELGRLLDATRTSAAVFRGMTGEDRHALYLTACGTGFRAAELAGLKPERFRLDDDPPAVQLGARKGKNRKPVTQPLPPGLVPVLREYLKGRPAGQRVWPGTWHEKGAEMLRADLEAVGIPYVVEGPDGPLYADFHALRHTFVSLLEQAGISVKQAMQLARHSDPKLTMARYGRAQIQDLGAALHKLPLLDEPAVRPAATDAAALLAGLSRAEVEALALVGLALLWDASPGESVVAPRVAPDFGTGEDTSGREGKRDEPATAEVTGSNP